MFTTSENIAKSFWGGGYFLTHCNWQTKHFSATVTHHENHKESELFKTTAPLNLITTHFEIYWLFT